MFIKTALIISYTGQDGTYLKELLIGMNYRVVGLSSSEIYDNENRGVKHGSIENPDFVAHLLKEVMPDELYYLAAVHQASVDKQMNDFELVEKSFAINTRALLNFLHVLSSLNPTCRLFYAASSHIFGQTESEMQNEQTAFNPICAYGISKTAGIQLCRFYRNNHGLFAAVGIFYNHESPLRSAKFVSTKIVTSAIAIKYGKQNELVLGDLNASIDWGYAPDYVKAAHKMLQLNKADDFIISSGVKHTVGEFVETVFDQLDLDWRQHVRVNPDIITKQNKRNLLGDNSKLRLATDWNPSVDFREMVSILVEAQNKQFMLAN